MTGSFWRVALRIFLLSLMLIALAMTVKDSTDHLVQKRYDVAKSTEIKINKISHWISPNSDFQIMFDVWRLMQKPAITFKIMDVLDEEGGGVYDLLKAFLTRNSVIGMLMFVGKFDSSGEPVRPQFLVIAQGNYDKDLMLENIKSAFDSSSVEVADLAGVNDNDIYCDNGDMQFCFSFLDDEHLGVGYRSSFDVFLSGLPSKTKLPEDVRNSIIAGQVMRAPKLVDNKKVKELYFWSDDGENLFAVLPYKSVAEAIDVRMFLEGMKSLLMLQHDGREGILKILNDIKIYDKDGDVLIEMNILNLLK